MRQKHEEASEYFYSDVKNYKKQALQAAKDLGYSKTVQNEIREAKTEAEIERIMVTARHGGSIYEPTAMTFKNTVLNSKYRGTGSSGERGGRF